MQKIKKPISILLSVLMVLSVFAVVPFTASATETFETLDLTQHHDDYAPKSFNGERFSVQVYGDEADITADEAGWLFDGDYPVAYASISAMNGETITKIVVHRTNDYDNTLIVKADDNTIPYSQNGDDFTYDNISASSVKLSADPDYPDDCYCRVSSIDVYYTGGSYPDVNNVYMATDMIVEVTIADLQRGDVIVKSPEPMEIQKGECSIVLVGGTYGMGDVREGILDHTYTDDVKLDNEVRFEFMDDARITNMDNYEQFVPVYNNSLGNAYIVLGNDNGTVYLAGYNFTTYTITWNDYDNSGLYDGQSTVAAGAVPSYRWTVSRDSTAQYTYTFTGWTDSSNTFYSKDSDLPAASKDETYTATYSETLRSYTITWKDGDNETLKSESVAYGTTPSYTGATPTKTEDDDYTYEFNNTWSPSVASVTGNATYTAQFDATPKTPAATASYVKVTSEPDDWSGDYLIVYEDEDDGIAFNGSADGLNSSGNYIYVTISGGEIASDAETDAAKVTIAQIDGGYSIATATGAYIGGVSGQNTMASSDDAIVNTISLEDDSAKIVSNTSTLRFNSAWSGFRYYRTVSQKPVQLYKLTGGSAPATYTVTWKNEDGTTLETDTDVAEGTTPTYDGATPEKAEDDYHSYNFSGWTDGTNTYGASDTLPAVTGDVTYTAKYTVFTKQFTVFVKTTTGKTITANGVSGDTTVAELKDMVVAESGIPAAEQRLIFAGKEMENAKTLADYNIQRESTIHVVGKSYTVTWKNDDGSVIDTATVAYGETPAHDDMTKDEVVLFTYTFDGWTPEIAPVTGDAEYTARFTAEQKGELIGDTYYIDGVVAKSLGVIKSGDDYYYIAMNGKIYKGKVFVTAAKSNGYVEPDTYVFGDDGKMILGKNGIVDGVYYENDKVVKGVGLVEFEGDYYYVMANGKVFANGKLSIGAAKSNGLVEPRTYEFDADGKMMIHALPQGAAIMDGYYYVDGVIVKSAGVVNVDGSLYYIMSNGKVYVGSISIGAAKSNGLIASGTYRTDENGVIAVIN